MWLSWPTTSSTYPRRAVQRRLSVSLRRPPELPPPWDPRPFTTEPGDILKEQHASQSQIRSTSVIDLVDDRAGVAVFVAPTSPGNRARDSIGSFLPLFVDPAAAEVENRGVRSELRTDYGRPLGPNTADLRVNCDRRY